MNGVKLLCIKLSNYAQKLPVGLNGISPLPSVSYTKTLYLHCTGGQRV
jgi:hypothetical protein